MSDNRLTFTGRIRSFSCAIRGLRVMIVSQHNAWIHALATVVVLLVSVYFQLARAEWCWIIVAIISVWTAEALNTAFEFLTDVASPEFHPLAEKAKDVAAGAVLITAIGSALIGLIVFGPYLIRLIRSW
jgi:diacylglycerol kinase (ATP)